MIGGHKLKELLFHEIRQREEEGCIIPEKFKNVTTDDREKLLKFYNELNSLEISPDFPYYEPDGLEDILKNSTGCTYKETPEKSGLFEKFYGAWLGRIIGCVMGKPIECFPYGSGKDGKDGWEFIKLYQEGAGDEFPPENYISDFSLATQKYGLTVTCKDSHKENISFAETDDDTRYTVLGYIINEKYGNNFTPEDVANEWHNYLPKNFVFTAEYVAMKNSYICEETDLQKKIDFCHSYFNPFREWIGAQIRIDHYGYYNAGDPLSAAKSAFNDATFSHTKNGVYGAMYFAALIACAFTEKNIEKCIETSLTVIPEKSRLHFAIKFTVEKAKKCNTAEDLYKVLWDEFGKYDTVHTINNAAVCVGALIMGKGDYLKSVSIAVGAGWDTDCNGATVGSFMGALLGEKAIPEYLKKPLNDTFYSSIINFHPAKISECAKKSYELYLGKDK